MASTYAEPRKATPPNANRRRSSVTSFDPNDTSLSSQHQSSSVSPALGGTAGNSDSGLGPYQSSDFSNTSEGNFFGVGIGDTEADMLSSLAPGHRSDSFNQDIRNPSIPWTSGTDTHSNPVNTGNKTGGQLVAVIAKGNSKSDDLGHGDNDKDDPQEHGDTDAESSKLSPNLAGFRQHILRLNPDMPKANAYLVDRIAHQQAVRYNNLLNAKLKHLRLGPDCPCGSFCQARGGHSVLLDQEGNLRNINSLSTGLDSTPSEGSVTKERSTQDIPSPIIQSLPAEFECPICFTLRKPDKPSDWTKHVCEDVQPFTCTWDICRYPKIFRRKADWIRHENETHRRLEWWTCEMKDCQHTCYRLDNFLQHLVREHKFIEPKIKTKAAIKEAGGIDATWQKVEECHHETSKRPEEEPCRFCGKQFPTWKKLTAHLANHMNNISLPVVGLVAAEELEPDTIISPVPNPPSRAPPSRASFNAQAPSAMMGAPSQPNYGPPSLYQPQSMVLNSNGPYQNVDFPYLGVKRNAPFHDHKFSPQYPGIAQPIAQNTIGMQSIGQGNTIFNQLYHNAKRMETQQQHESIIQGTKPFPTLDHNVLGLHQLNHMGVSTVHDELVGKGKANENQYDLQAPVSYNSQSPSHGSEITSEPFCVPSFAQPTAQNAMGMPSVDQTTRVSQQQYRGKTNELKILPPPFTGEQQGSTTVAQDIKPFHVMPVDGTSSPKDEDEPQHPQPLQISVSFTSSPNNHQTQLSQETQRAAQQTLRLANQPSPAGNIALTTLAPLDSQMAEFDYTVCSSWRIFSLFQDSWKRSIETVAGSQLSWWPLTEPEAELKPGYTRVYSIPTATRLKKAGRFYDHIPTPLAEKLFPNLSRFRSSYTESRWRFLRPETVVLQGTTLMHVLQQWTENEEIHRIEMSESPLADTTNDVCAIGKGLQQDEGVSGASRQSQEIQQPTNQTAEESNSRKPLTTKKVVFITTDVTVNESVACTSELGENDETTFRNLYKSFCALPSGKWKRAIGLKFYRVLSLVLIKRKENADNI